MSTFPRWLKITLILAAMLMLGGLAWYYRAQRQRRLQEVNTNLETIMQPKLDWIDQWRTNRKNQAALVSENRLYVSSAMRWMKTPPASEEIEAVLASLRAESTKYLNRDALFVNAAGKIYFHMSIPAVDLASETRKALDEAFRTKEHVVTDLYSDPGDKHPQMDLVVPLYEDSGDSLMPVGAIIYQFDAFRIYYTMLEIWPVETQTAEVQLLRRDGDSVLFLNEMRHRKGTALAYRIPLSQKETIEVQAMLGKRGALQGKDYRGINVVSFIQSAPNTPWLLVLKQDESEVFADMRREFAIILATFIFLILSATTAVGVLWQRRDRAYYQAMFEAEAAQRKSETRYQNTLDGMMEGCHIINTDWRCTYVNAASVRQFRRAKEEVLGHSVTDSIPGIQNTEAFGALQRCMNERTSQHIECSLNSPDGTKRWYEFSIQPIPEGIFVLTNDITKRKQTEESLRESESRYHALFMHMNQGVILLQADGKVLDVNPAALSMLGLTKDELIGKIPDHPDWEVVHEDDSIFLREEYPMAVTLRTGTAANAAMGLWDPSRKSRIWMEVNATPLLLDGDNKPYQVLITLHDITERKLAQAEQDRLAAAIEQTGEVVVIIDTNKIIQYANPAFETVTGYKREDAIGRQLPALIIDSQDEEFHRRFWDTLKSGKPWKGRLINRKKDGSLYTDEATVSPVLNASGAIVNYVCVTRDITEYLKLQNEKEKLQEQFLQMQKIESVGRLAGGIAHDFNNMLSVISGHTQMALETLDTANPLYVHLQEINMAALRSADLTRQLLAFARKQTIAPKVLNLNSTVGRSLSVMQRLIGEDIDLSWNPGRNLWPVRIDPAQIDQVLTNLAVNSRDAIEQHGKVAIETSNVVIDEAYCSGHRGFVPGEYVRLSFSDDGCGMDKEVIDHLFEPFFTTKEVGKGTGLGLATVYGIIRQNDGFIIIYSEPGRGTTLKIYLPRYSGEKTAAEETGIRTEPPRGGIETILVVEDELSVLKLTKLMLEHMGYTVIAASAPSEALRLAEIHDGEIHLLLVDVVMPEMTGRELSEKLSPLRPGLKTVFMSGYTADVIAHRGVLDEGVHFIQKPFSAKDLSAKMREVLED
jgi:two-component system, cell cycle sensor histidine kinase and response regulator CckA